MKIAFFEIDTHEEKIFTELLAPHELFFCAEKLSAETMHKAHDAECISVFVNSQVTKNIIDALPSLRYVTTRSTGFDHIDTAYCKEKGIVVSNVPAYGADTVAEFTFALLLTLSRKVFDASVQIKESKIFSITNLCGFDLAKKTIGIIGMGRIGKNVANIALGFGMNVVAYDKFPDQAFALGKNITYKTLDEVFALSDVITLHAPYTPENHHLIHKDAILKMKKGVYIINTARGELIDTAALVWGINEKIIAGAGLDVLEGEREIKEERQILSSSEKSDMIKDYKIILEDHLLIDMPEVIVTPHIAFYSKEAEASIVHTTIENITTFINSAPQNIIK